MKRHFQILLLVFSASSLLLVWSVQAYGKSVGKCALSRLQEVSDKNNGVALISYKLKYRNKGGRYRKIVACNAVTGKKVTLDDPRASNARWQSIEILSNSKKKFLLLQVNTNDAHPYSEIGNPDSYKLIWVDLSKGISRKVIAGSEDAFSKNDAALGSDGHVYLVKVRPSEGSFSPMVLYSFGSDETLTAVDINSEANDSELNGVYQYLYDRDESLSPAKISIQGEGESERVSWVLPRFEPHIGSKATRSFNVSNRRALLSGCGIGKGSRTLEAADDTSGVIYLNKKTGALARCVASSSTTTPTDTKLSQSCGAGSLSSATLGSKTSAFACRYENQDDKIYVIDNATNELLNTLLLSDLVGRSTKLAEAFTSFSVDESGSVAAAAYRYLSTKTKKKQVTVAYKKSQQNTVKVKSTTSGTDFIWVQWDSSIKWFDVDKNRFSTAVAN